MFSLAQTISSPRCIVYESANDALQYSLLIARLTRRQVYWVLDEMKSEYTKSSP